MSDDGPLLVRPVPRRPFTLTRQSATPTDDDPPTQESSSTLPNGAASSPAGLSSHLTAALAAWDKGGSSEQPSPSISRAASVMNLTTSTLYGIYSPTAGTALGGRDPNDNDDSPWGMGAQTPIRRPDVDEPTFELMRERSHLTRRRSSYKGAEMPRVPPPHVSTLQTGLRTALLFVLGLGYGALVTRLHDHEKGADTPALIEPGFSAAYLGAWGVAGVVLGSLLPWFDGVWEAKFGASDEDEDVVVIDGENTPSKALDTGMDWVLVMRAIGAFVGIVFAIVSPLQPLILQFFNTLCFRFD